MDDGDLLDDIPEYPESDSILDADLDLLDDIPDYSELAEHTFVEKLEVKYDKSIPCPPSSRWRMQTLYTYDALGALRMWSIECDGKHLFIEHGHVDGKKQLEMVNIKPKSHRTVNEQAWLEACSRYNDNVVGNGYSPDPDSVTLDFDQDENVMLANKYEYGKTTLMFPVDLSIKFDGVRFKAYMHNGAIVMKTRDNRVFPHFKHIKSELSYFFDDDPKLVIDGELYIHGMDLQDIRGITGTTKIIHPREKEMNAVIFDLILDGTPFHTRYDRLLTMELKYGTRLKSISFAHNTSVNSHDEIQAFHDKCKEDGYEGCMVRLPDSFYEKKRCNQLLKYKMFDDEEATLIDIINGDTEGGREDGCAVFILRRDNGLEFKCRPRGSLALRREWYDNRYSLLYTENGKSRNLRYTYKYFGFNHSGKPNLPIGLAFRDEVV